MSETSIETIIDTPTEPLRDSHTHNRDIPLQARQSLVEAQAHLTKLEVAEVKKHLLELGDSISTNRLDVYRYALELARYRAATASDGVSRSLVGVVPINNDSDAQGLLERVVATAGSEQDFPDSGGEIWSDFNRALGIGHEIPRAERNHVTVGVFVSPDLRADIESTNPDVKAFSMNLSGLTHPRTGEDHVQAIIYNPNNINLTMESSAVQLSSNTTTMQG